MPVVIVSRNCHPRKDLAGKRFGMLVIEKVVGQDKHGSIYWKAFCDCGEEKLACAHRLKAGRLTNCGCNLGWQAKNNRIHGMCESRTYKSWNSMLTRCRTKRGKTFEIYAARGIRVCERWNKFENFFADMGERPPGRSSVDRINTNGNYEPSNCRWAYPQTQNRNMRSNRLITYAGKTQCFSAWVDEKGLSENALHYRLSLGKWSLEKAMETPIRAHRFLGRKDILL